MKPSDPLNLSVLVVEDDWLLREQIVSNLQEEGYSVIEAEAGRDALDLLETAYRIDLLITDIRLSDSISGWEVAQAFRERDKDLPVIYASSSPPNDRRRVEDTTFLAKPYSATDLLNACRTVSKK